MKIPTSIIEVPKTNPKIAINKKTLPGQFNNILRKFSDKKIKGEETFFWIIFLWRKIMKKVIDRKNT